MDSLAIILSLAALIAGLALGWLLRGKAVAPLAAEKAELVAKLAQAAAQRRLAGTGGGAGPGGACGRADPAAGR